MSTGSLFRSWRAVGALLAVLAVSGCKGDDQAPLPPPPPAPSLGDVFPTLPIPPDALPLSQESGQDVAQLLFVSPIPPDSIVEYYRETLTQDQYRLLSEQSSDGVTIFVAEQQGRGLWVTVQSDSAGGSAVMLAGAMVGSSAKAAARQQEPSGQP